MYKLNDTTLCKIKALLLNITVCKNEQENNKHAKKTCIKAKDVGGRGRVFWERKGERILQ